VQRGVGTGRRGPWGAGAVTVSGFGAERSSARGGGRCERDRRSGPRPWRRGKGSMIGLRQR
jgi:hypothetical protein